MSDRNVQEQLVDLQTQFAFQEDLLQVLNDVVTRQQAQIEALQRELSLHRDKLTHVLENLPSKGEGSSLSNERPPHY
jgi:SlyX protein